MKTLVAKEHHPKHMGGSGIMLLGSLLQKGLVQFTEQMASLGREKICGHIEAVSQDKWVFKSTLTPKDAFKRLKDNKVEVWG